MKFSQRQVLMIIGGIILAIIIVVVVVLAARPSSKNVVVGKLSVWGTEDSGEFSSIANSYPYANITYTQIDPATYNAQVLSALAAGTGPDVFEIGNRSVPRWQPVLTPLPASLAAQFGPVQMASTFPDVVAQDFVVGGHLYALPLSIDTLALIYNKDLFNSAGIVDPPATWDDFETDVVKLRLMGSGDQITRAGAAIGGSDTSIPHASDLLALLMLQNGTTMTNSALTSAQFASDPNSEGLSAFNFYLQFANVSSPYYTWNDQMGNAADSFAAGKTAMMFAYQADLATIQAKAPFLSIGIAPMPQPTGASITINYPSYEGFAVSKAGHNAALAWNFVLYLTTTPASEKMYLSATGKPPALRSAIAADENSESLSVYASQVLTAKSWYEPDDTQTDAALNAAIQNVLSGDDDSTTALSQAQASVNALF